MAKGSKSTKAAAQARDDRQSSESGADNDHDHDDHDHDQDNDNDNDNDNENENEQPNDGGAPVKRKRLTQACDPCRKKKIKCDGNKPSCANCAKLDVNCTYLPSMKKRGPRQGYIELLEKRLDKMEQLLQHGPSAVDPEFLESRNLLGSRYRRGNQSTSPTGDENDKDQTRHKADPDTRYFGTTSGYSSQYTTEYDRQNDPSKNQVGPKYSSQATLPGKDRPRNPLYGIKDEIPRKDVLDHLIELYFDSLYFQMPIIHPGTFMRQYKEGKVSPNLLNALCAAVARFSNHPDVVTTPTFLAGEPFATNLRGMLVDSIDVPTVSNVQALLFLSMYEYGAARGPRAWMFGGMAVRQAQELGLNREDSSPVFYLKGDWVMRETRRRTFWACFIMDVLAASSSGRPRMMDERDCEVLLPSEDHDWYDERPVVTEMLDDEHDSSSGTEQEHDHASDPFKHAGEGQPYTKDRGQPLYPVTKNDKDSTMETDQSNAPQPTDPMRQTYSTENAQSNEGDASTSKSKKQGGSTHTLSSFAYLIRIVAVLGKVSQYVNRPRSKKSIPPNEPHSEFSVIDAALAAWLKSIPPQLAYSLENGKFVKDKGEGCIIVFMHVIYHTTVVLLHRPILAADRASFPIDSNFVENSVARCADAASKVSDVLEFVTAFHCPPRVFISAFFAYPVFTTATIHITNAFASDPTVAARARRSLSIHVKILQTMKSYWSMADKFFYIIRDLYSIQSKISSSAPGSGIVVPQVVSHNPHAYRKSDDVRGKKPIDIDSSDNKRPNPAANRGDEIDHQEEEGASSTDNQLHNNTAPKMVVNSKLASISSFLKSDSGLIALWRRATEMQVLDEAKQEKRRLSQSEEPNTTGQPVLAIEHKRQPEQLTKEELEERMRMNDLEIQEINQEYERRWKARVEQAGVSSGTSSKGGVANETVTSVPESVEKRTKDQDLPYERASKHARVAKEPTTKGHKKGKSYDGSSPASTIMSDVSGLAGSPTSSSSGSPYQQDVGLTQNSGTYRHAVILQPPQLQQRDTYLMQPIQIPPTTMGPGVGAGAREGSGAKPPGSSGGDMAQHLSNLYAQQHANQEAQAQTIEMIQNANIQRQQLQLQQQQQQAHLSSLAFGPPGGFNSSFLSPSSLPMQTQSQSAPALGLPLVYGSSYDDGQASRMQTEPMDSIFDFAFPMADLSFLSSSFQMTPMMMQTSMANTMPMTTSGMQQQPQQQPHQQPQQPQQQPQQPQSQQQSHPLMSPGVIASSIVQQNTNVNSPPVRNSNGSNNSPSTLEQNTFNISPGLQSFLMSDDAFGTQSTPNDLIRYLQHHQQQQQQQELQQQNMEPVLNQENSLIYDDYYPWSAFAPQPLQPQ
ncbi:hypothetical protein CPC16_003283 [Podila verticillata]|nr:hypothetical protein CPC16_003283 [Podila verticillata]